MSAYHSVCREKKAKKPPTGGFFISKFSLISLQLYIIDKAVNRAFYLLKEKRGLFCPLKSIEFGTLSFV